MTSNRISDAPSNKPDDAVDQPLKESAGDGAGVGQGELAGSTMALVVVDEPAHNRMLACPGGAAGNMEVPARLVSARNAILMLPHQQVVPVGDVPLSREVGPQWIAMQRDLRRAHTQGFVDDVWAKFVAGDPEMAASLTAVTSVLSVADRVLSASPGGQLSGFAMVRPAGHHSTTDRPGPLCVVNSVMVAALREAAAGSTVGVLDIDVHFASGSQQIALQWNEHKAASEGRVLVADIYGAMGPPARIVEKVQTVQREHGAVNAAALKAEMGLEFPSASPQEQEVIDMICDSHLLFPFDREELGDEALVASTARSVRHFLEHRVEIVFVSLGLDAAAGDREGARVTPTGFGRAAAMLRASGLKLVFALEGGYDIGNLDVGNSLCRSENASDVDLDRCLGTGNFGKCVHAVALALVECE